MGETGQFIKDFIITMIFLALVLMIVVPISLFATGGL